MVFSFMINPDESKILPEIFKEPVTTEFEKILPEQSKFPDKSILIPSVSNCLELTLLQVIVVPVPLISPIMFKLFELKVAALIIPELSILPDESILIASAVISPPITIFPDKSSLPDKIIFAYKICFFSF